MDPLEWLARLADHIPEPGQHRARFYAHCADRVRGERPGQEEPGPADEPAPTRHRKLALVGTLLHPTGCRCRECQGRRVIHTT